MKGPKSIIILAMAILAAGCSTPPTASRISIGGDTAELPKAGQYNAKYEYTNVMTGEHRILTITDATVDPSAALKAFTETQAGNLRVLEAAVNKIAVPGVVAPTASPAPTPPR